MVDIKNIIIIGKVGSGKSALANVLIDDKTFKEADSSLTKRDSKLPKEELLEKFEEEIGVYIEEGISQVFFVISGRIDKEVLEEFFWLNKYLFDSEIFDYTTIIRTNFTDFKSKEKREEDIKELKTFFSENKEYEEINNKIFKEGEEKVIHLNNPPTNEKSSESKNNQTELEKLKSPEEFTKFKYLSGIEYVSTATTVVGGALTLLDFSTTGGVITLTAPLVGEEDADKFLDNFNELLGTLKRVSGGELGEVNFKLRELKSRVEDFLKDYDKDGNREIDVDELINERIKFSKELDKIEAIEKAIKELEKEVIKYKKGSVGVEEEETEQKSK
ncbi:5243_t:CDS:2, partial [Cetraspora pellucida]